MSGKEQTSRRIVINIISVESAHDENGPGIVARVRKVLDFEMTIAEWIGTALMLAVPYLAVGVLWACLHTEHLKGGDWVHRVVLIVGTIASWPGLLVSGTYLA